MKNHNLWTMVFVHFSLTERFNHTLTTHLMKVVNEKDDDWDDHLDPVLFGYRVNVQSSTKTTPFELLYGVKARLPIDIEQDKTWTPKTRSRKLGPNVSNN